MTTYGTRNYRLFWNQSQFSASVTRRKRSVCRLKAYNSSVDNRVWSNDLGQRRQAILEIINHSCSVGSAFPVEVLLSHLCEGNQSNGNHSNSAELKVGELEDQLNKSLQQIECLKTILDNCRTCQDELKCTKIQLAICKSRTNNSCPISDEPDCKLMCILEELDKCRQELAVQRCVSPCGDVVCHCLDPEPPCGYIPCYKLVECLHAKAEEIENKCKCINKICCSDTNLNSIEEDKDYCSSFGNSGDPSNPCKKVDSCDPCNSFVSSNKGKQYESSCRPCRPKDSDICRSRSVSFSKQSSTSSVDQDASTAVRTYSKEKMERKQSRSSSSVVDDSHKVSSGSSGSTSKNVGRGFLPNSNEDVSPGYPSSTDESSKDKEICCLKEEIKKLKCLLEKQYQTECELDIATRTVAQLRSENDMLQDCLSKQKREICEMMKICEQQQGQITFLQNVECKLKEVCMQRDELKRQVEELCSSQRNVGSMSMTSCMSEDMKKLKMLECQKKELEKERDVLLCKIQKLECAAQEKDCEITKLTMKANKLQQTLLCLQNSPTKNSLSSSTNCIKCIGGEDNYPVHRSSSDTCYKDLKCIQEEMQLVQKKVNQQEKVIESQNKCLQEQHCYILEQEELRVGLRNKVKELTEQQIQLLHERNKLSNEIRCLSLKLGKSLNFDNCDCD